MAQTVYDERFEKWLAEYLDEKLPEKIYDAHYHINRKYAAARGFEGKAFEQYIDFMEKYVPRPILGGLIMAQPNSRHTAEDIADENEYIIGLAKKHNLDVGVLIPPYYTREQTEKILDENPEVKMLKPYLTYVEDKENALEADISAFAPEWMWKLANDRKMPIMIHLSHYQDMLWDEANIREIRYFCEKYPDMKLILAHCAMGHNAPKLKLGIEKIKDLKNIWFDFSGSTETMSIYYCIKEFGAEKMMFGGDHNHGESLGRICSFGTNFIGLHPGFVDMNYVNGSPYKYQPLNNMQESLMCFFQAAELLDLSKEDVEKIFYYNAKEIFR